MSQRHEANAPWRRLSNRCESWAGDEPTVSQTCLNCYQGGDTRLWHFWNRCLLSNLHTLGSRFPFNEAEKCNNSTIEEGKQCVGNESPPEVVCHIHRRPGSDTLSYSQSTKGWWKAEKYIIILNVDRAKSGAAVRLRPKDGEAAGIFRGHSLVKQQTQQPQPHLVIWLLAVAYSYSKQLDSSTSTQVLLC